ncbi:DNA-directed RNA polymerase subunit P [Candidatus Micrarchaeota archaeon]|nr:DNA-directed RNA polymerase subunit P [Candidatus Micrarchaeota archaeon]
MDCGKVVEDIKVVKCPYCGYRVLYKERQPVVRNVKTD